MATFQPVNTTLIPDPHTRNGEETNPLTPRPNTAPNTQVQMPRDDATTPTRANFGALASQRPLPAATSFPPPTPDVKTEEQPPNTLNRGNSTYSANSRDSQDDVEMGEDGQDGEEEEDDGSGEEIINPDGTRSKKKGKSQRFYCTEYPPCQLSFTRSEHLARHIRKHTGERPFQCHCSRRFSRLDNLRQHAQTVHQNEEIPQDSLAATGTRFQRQVRTDRVRPPGSRARGSTVGSQTGPVRGHHRNSLSTSSIGSVGSAYSPGGDLRRRPPPLVMAGDPNRNRYSQEFGRAESPSGQYPYRGQSPGGFSTPTSATFSTGQNSPRWTNEMASPISSHSRTASIYAGHRTPGRRLSVPSAGIPSSGNPFQSPHSNFGGPILGQIQHPNMGVLSPSSSLISSPTTPGSTSTWSRRESISGEGRSNDEAWRRRTWHPDSYTNVSSAFTSRLQQVTTPNTYAIGTPPQPPVVPSNAPRLDIRLPGIASFDPVPRPATPPMRREPSPMLIDTPSRAPQSDPYRTGYRGERPNSQHWDQGMNRGFTQLNIQQAPPPDAASSWASEANRAVQAQAEQARAQPVVRFEDSPYSARPQTSGGAYHSHHQSAPPVTPREAKRMGWYQGPVASQPQIAQQPLQRTSPADSSSSEGAGIPGTPRSSAAVESNPGILHSSGYVERHYPPHQEQRYATYPPPENYAFVPSQQTPTQAQHPQIPKPNEGSNISRLEALVAVATSEENVGTAY